MKTFLTIVAVMLLTAAARGAVGGGGVGGTPAPGSGTDDQTAAEVGVTATPDNYSAGDGSVEGHLEGVDEALGTIAATAASASADAGTAVATATSALDRANHTGTQTSGTITPLTESVADATTITFADDNGKLLIFDSADAVAQELPDDMPPMSLSFWCKGAGAVTVTAATTLVDLHGQTLSSLVLQTGELVTFIAEESDVWRALISRKVEIFAMTIINPADQQTVTDTVTVMPIESAIFPNGVTLHACGIKTDNAGSYSVTFEVWTDPATHSADIETVATSTSREASDDGTLTTTTANAGTIIKADLPNTAGTVELVLWVAASRN